MPLIRHPSRSRFRFRSPVYGLGTALLVICGLNMPVQAKTPHSALSSGQDISLAQNTSVAQNTPIAQTPIPPKIDLNKDRFNRDRKNPVCFPRIPDPACAISYGRILYCQLRGR